MAVDFSNVQVGDRVRLSRENGDESNFTVRVTDGDSLESASNCYLARNWDSLEILAKPLPTVNGSVIKSNADGATFVLAENLWVDVRNREVLRDPKTTPCHWEILFVPGEKESK